MFHPVNGVNILAITGVGAHLTRSQAKLFSEVFPRLIEGWFHASGIEPSKKRGLGHAGKKFYGLIQVRWSCRNSGDVPGFCWRVVFLVSFCDSWRGWFFCRRFGVVGWGDLLGTKRTKTQLLVGKACWWEIDKWEFHVAYEIYLEPQTTSSRWKWWDNQFLYKDLESSINDCLGVQVCMFSFVVGVLLQTSTLLFCYL